MFGGAPALGLKTDKGIKGTDRYPTYFKQLNSEVYPKMHFVF